MRKNYKDETFVELFIDDTSIDGLGGEAEINKNNEIIGTKKLKLFSNGLTKGYFYRNEKYKKISVNVIATCNLLIKKDISLNRTEMSSRQ